MRANGNFVMCVVRGEYQSDQRWMQVQSPQIAATHFFVSHKDKQGQTASLSIVNNQWRRPSVIWIVFIRLTQFDVLIR